jgi:PD-(D/E)XK nuclease superfamily/Domain of unknown function (DUF2357)
MASSHTSRLSFVTLSGEPLTNPTEWDECHLLIGCDRSTWDSVAVSCNGRALPLTFVDRPEGRRLAARWPRSGPGTYEMQLTSGSEITERTSCRVLPSKLDDEELSEMMDDLQRELPASIAVALQRCGAFADVRVVPPNETLLAEEFLRLRRAIDGGHGRLGLAAILVLLNDKPHRALESADHWRHRSRARHIDPTRLIHAFAKAGNVGRDGLPVIVPERRTLPTTDVYENRFLSLYYTQVLRRLDAVSAAIGRRPDPRMTFDVADLRSRLVRARNRATFLNDVQVARLTTVGPTMVFLRVREYKAAFEGFLELNRRLLVELREPLLEAPLTNLPYLYETWGLLSVLASTVDVAADLGYEIVQQSLVTRSPGEAWVQLLRVGRPVVVLRHPATGSTVEIIPQRRYVAGAQDLRSISFTQNPDVAIEITRDARTTVFIFDPKYKVNEVTGDSRPDKADIDAMHAYRDAIRDDADRHVVEHAAILYLGAAYVFGAGLSALAARPGRVAELRQAIRDTVAQPLAAAAGSG